MYRFTVRHYSGKWYTRTKLYQTWAGVQQHIDTINWLNSLHPDHQPTTFTVEQTDTNWKVVGRG